MSGGGGWELLGDEENSNIFNVEKNEMGIA